MHKPDRAGRAFLWHPVQRHGLDGAARVLRALADELAEHHMIECLAEALWQGQRNGLPPDEAAYLAALTRMVADA